MRYDVLDLREFYRTPLGRLAYRRVARALRTFWPHARGERILAIGYGPPYLPFYSKDAERVIAAMPARQGVSQWPREQPNLSVLVHETELPFTDGAFDKIILVHSLEMTDQAGRLISECWRVLNASGRLIVVAPNRRGVWARNDLTPFGFGTPYSRSQLDGLLRNHLFDPVQHVRTLFTPPVRSRFILALSPVFHFLGPRLFPRFGGLIVMEAQKRLYAARLVTESSRFQRPVIIPLPAS